MKAAALAFRILPAIAPLYRWAVRRETIHGDVGQDVPLTYREAAYRNCLALPPAVLHGSCSQMANLTYVDGHQLARCQVVLGAKDPWTPESVATRGLAELGFPEGNFHRLAAGGHLPQCESVAHPEWTARNQDDLVHIVSSMLTSAQASSRPSTPLESTIVANGSASTDAVSKHLGR